jgi:hypothetical protein
LKKGGGGIISPSSIPSPVSAGMDLRGRKERRKNGRLFFVKRFNPIV